MGGVLSGQPTDHMDGWRPSAGVLVLGLPVLVATALLKTMQISTEAGYLNRFSVQFRGGAELRFILRSNNAGEVLEAGINDCVPE